jgi:DNA repair protein RadC
MAAPVRTLARTVREMPADERPRERLLAHGSAGLADSELLAILLRVGKPGIPALELARRVLEDAGGLAALPGSTPEELRRTGLGPAQTATVLAGIELARRLSRARLAEREPLARPAAAARYLALRYADRRQEVMGALYLDTRNRLLGEDETYRGTLNRAAVEPRALLRRGLELAAAGLLLFHTHPSGDPSPSAEDLAFTRRLAEAGDIVGIRLVDHLVLGAGGAWVSLRQRGGW